MKERTELRLKLLANGYVPLLNHGKVPRLDGWPEIKVTQDLIRGWDRSRHASTGLRIEGGLGVVDVDVDDSLLVTALADRSAEAMPGLFEKGLVRFSGGAKEAWFARVDGLPFGRTASRLFVRPGDDPDDPAVPKHRVEVFGGASSRQFGAFGPHSFNADGTVKTVYSWDGPSPADIPLADLPGYAAGQFGRVCDIFEAVAREAGLVDAAPAHRSGDPELFYALEPDTVIETEAHGELTVAELEAIAPELNDGDYLRCSGTFHDRTRVRTNSHAAAIGRHGIGVYDFMTGATWCRADRKPPDWGAIGRAIEAAARKGRLGDVEPEELSREGKDSEEHPDSPAQVELSDFIYLSPANKFIFKPTTELWPIAAVDRRLPSVKTGPKRKVSPSTWIIRTSSVEQMTWDPREPEIIEGKLYLESGIASRPGARVFNTFVPMPVLSGDAAQATRWLEHMRLVYPDHVGHITGYFAHLLQRPGVKINHALVFGGEQGIGKDTICTPLMRALGEWNKKEITPPDLFGTFNEYVRTLFLLISEARDTGEVNPYQFYERTKTLFAAPPTVLRLNPKYVPAYYVPNVLGAVITTNHKLPGLYLPPEDRRHYVCWSNLRRDSLDKDYFPDLHAWFEREGNGHVAAWLRELDLSAFDAKAPPPLTDAFWEIVNGQRPHEESILSAVFDWFSQQAGLGTDQNGSPVLPPAITLEALLAAVGGHHIPSLDHAEVMSIRDFKHRRVIPMQLQRIGYVVHRNLNSKEGRWFANGRQVTIYVLEALSPLEQHDAVQALLSAVAGDDKVAAGAVIIEAAKRFRKSRAKKDDKPK